MGQPCLPALFFCPKRTYAFRCKEAWHPPDHATPLNFPSAKSLVPELSSEVLFVSVLVMVLSEYWKRLEENFRNKIISTISLNDEIYKKDSSSLFQCSERTIASTETNNNSEESYKIHLFVVGKFEVVTLSGGHHTPLAPKSIFCWILWPLGGFLTSCILWGL